jgi:uncharacterized membrane protein
MPEANSAPNELPPHIEQSVQSIARLHADHHYSATPQERAVERMTTVLGQVNSIVALAVGLAVWVCLNLLADAFGYRPLDPPPFVGLTSTVSVASIFLVVLILVSEQRAAALTERREQLTLELAILSERKIAKAIELLEELRRDGAQPRHRADAEAADMARPSDPEAVIAAIDATQPR